MRAADVDAVRACDSKNGPAGRLSVPDDFERFTLPSGTSVWYSDSTHAYHRHNPKTGKKGKRLTGVTTVVKTLDPDPSRLLAWAARIQCIGIAERYQEGGSLDWLSSQESIVRELEEHELTFDDVRDRAATEGTNVHRSAFEALAKGKPIPDLDMLVGRERGLADAVMAFFLDYSPEAEQVEQVVYSERLGVAGRLDFRGKLKGYDGIGVVDLKTGRYLSAAAHAQVGGGYPLLAEESGFGPSDFALILKVSEDGTYELIPAEAEPRDFEVAVEAYRASGRINGAARRSFKERREAVAA